MINPVVRALWENKEDEIAKAVTAELAYSPSPVNAVAVDAFLAWCEKKGVRSCPVRPAVLARYALDGGDEKQIANIGDWHTSIGLANPAMTPIVSMALEKLKPVEHPRSWPKEHWPRFAALPYVLRSYLKTRDVAQEKIVRAAQNKAAEARKETK